MEDMEMKSAYQRFVRALAYDADSKHLRILLAEVAAEQPQALLDAMARLKYRHGGTYADWYDAATKP